MANKQAPTTTVKGTVTHKQAQALDSLIGSVGANRQDVVGKILTMWLYTEGIVQKVALNYQQPPPKAK